MIPKTYTSLPDETEHLITTVIDSGIKIHRELGPGFIEAVYRNAMCVELGERQVPFETESGFTARYRDRPVAFQRVDLFASERSEGWPANEFWRSDASVWPEANCYLALVNLARTALVTFVVNMFRFDLLPDCFH